MSSESPRPPQRLASGTMQVLVAESLVFPVGLATAAYLGRMLGPRDYGILAVAIAVSDVLEWTLTSMFSRATVQLIGESDDWRPPAAAMLRLLAFIGCGLGVLFYVAADPLAHALGEPSMATALRLLALEVPIVASAVACRNVLTGRGQFRERATSSALRWIARLIFVVGLVNIGLAIRGAVVGEILASATWLVLGITFARIPIAVPGPSGGNRRLWSLVRPLFLLALSQRVLDRVGILALKMLGASAREAGWYAAAQNFGIAPGLFAVSFSPLLLAALSRSVRGGDLSAGRPLVRTALRLLFGLLPFVAFGAGAAPEVVRLIYGRGYEPAARLALPLLAGALGLAAISIASAILTAVDEAARVTRLVLPVTIASVVALGPVVPRYGAMGAAIVIGSASLVSAVILLRAIALRWDVLPPVGTVIRTSVVAAATLAAGLAWPAYGPWLAVKTLIFVAGIVIALAILGEFSGEDVRLARGLMGFRRPGRAEP